MIRRVPLVQTALTAICAAGLSAAAPPSAHPARAAGAGACKTVAVSGAVELRTTMTGDTSGRSIRRGESLPAGAAIWTGDDGHLTVVCDTSTMILGPRSTVELSLASLDRMRMTQNSGRVTYEVVRRGAKHFEVATPYLVAGVKGTVFEVAVADNGAEVEVIEGLVEVTSIESGERIDVGAGESARLSGDDTSGKIERIRPQAERRGTNDDRKRGPVTRTPPTETTRIAFDGQVSARESTPSREDELSPSLDDNTDSHAETEFNDALDRFDSEARVDGDLGPVSDEPIEDAPDQGGSFLRPGFLAELLDDRAATDPGAPDDSAEDPCRKHGITGTPAGCAGRTPPVTTPGTPGGGGGGGGAGGAEGVGAGAGGAGAVFGSTGGASEDGATNSAKGSVTGPSVLDETPAGDPHAEPPPPDAAGPERSRTQPRRGTTSGRGR